MAGNQKESWVETRTIRQKERLGAVLRVFGEKDINQVGMDDITAAISFKIKQAAVETARRTISLIRQLFEYADTMGKLNVIKLRPNWIFSYQFGFIF